MSQLFKKMQLFFSQRKELKQVIKEQYKADKAQQVVRKREFKEMVEEDRVQAKKDDQVAKQQAKASYKTELKQASKAERKVLKKERKIYRKIKNTPIRRSIWVVVLGLVLFVGVKFGPTIGDMYTTMSGKGIDLTTNTPAAKAAREAGESVSEEIANEGIILLKNEEQHLPLADKKMNVFSTAAFNFRYGGGGSGGSDTSRAISLFDGLKNAGIEPNEKLRSFYEELPEIKDMATAGGTGLIQVVKSMSAKGSDDEPTIDYLTEEVLKEAQSYSNNAMILIASSGVESSDMAPEELKLTENKRQLIAKVSETFENVTIVINSGNTLELGFIEEFPQIKSVLWVGTPGPYGTNALGNVLTGKTNPSGRTTDTYAYDISSAPATENFGNYEYENLDKAFVNYQEGIYIGYRYYETFYENDEAAYQKAVQYPFGYGLSYTDFAWKVTDKEFNDKEIKVAVEVTNTGKVSGKEVVQLYYSAPYLAGSLEKSAISLGAYGKTQFLAPGEKEIIELSFPTNNMASYDSAKEEAYVLDQGKYQIKLARNVHEITESFDYEIAKRKVIKVDLTTGTTLENKFAEGAGEFDYLTREDWEGSYPSDKDLNHQAPQFVLDEVAKEPTDSKLPMPAYGKDNGLKLADLKGLAYSNPKWDEFLDQLTKEEMVNYVTHGAYKTDEIDRLGIPGTVLLDGPAGINFFFKKTEAASYPTEVVLASSWNDALAYKMGEAVGNESRAYGIHGWYAPGMNLHRTAQGGRNFEYFSEDPIISGKMAGGLISGAQDQGVIVFMKHFAMNDQETNARSGLYVWANEQSIRELHLKPFEMTVKEVNVLGAMSSFSYINGKWSGANPELLNDVLRDEWGFEGFVSSDAVFDFMHADDAIVSGNDLMLDIMSASTNKKRVEKAYKKDPSGTAKGLRDSTKRVLYTILKTYLFE